MFPVVRKTLRCKGLRVFLRVACRVLLVLEIGCFFVAVWVLYGFFRWVQRADLIPFCIEKAGRGSIPVRLS